MIARKPVCRRPACSLAVVSDAFDDPPGSGLKIGMFGVFAVPLEVVLPARATTPVLLDTIPIPRSTAPVCTVVAPPPPKYVAYFNSEAPLALVSNFIRKESFVPWNVVWKPRTLAGAPLKATVECVLPPRYMRFPFAESITPPQPISKLSAGFELPSVVPPPTFK
jgi:hypothetical protein